MPASARLLRDLAGQIGSDHVYSRPADLAAYAYDAFSASGERHLPDAVVFPASTEEVAGVVQVCAHHGVAMVPRGAGTGYAGGSVARTGGVIVCLTRMTHVIGVETDAMRIKVEAGVLTATVHRAAADLGLYYPPDPGSSSTSTIGGNVACNAAGPHALRYGVTSDYVVGLTVVLADGRIVDAGEGAGNNEVLGAVPGSEGTLGIVTEVLLRLIPAPAARATMAATFDSIEAAAKAVAAITAAGVVPAACEYMDSAALAAVAAAGFTGVDPSAGAMLIVEVEGDAAATEKAAAAVRIALDTAGAVAVESAASAEDADRLWRVRQAISAAVAAVMIGKVNEDVVVPRPAIAELVNTARDIAERHDLPLVTFGHAGDGNLHLSVLIDPRIAGDRARADAAMAEIFEKVRALGGAITGEHGVGTSKLAEVNAQLGGATAALMWRVKQTMDPRNLMNPGKKILAPEVPSGRETVAAQASSAARSDSA